jgi:hypothetical protein
MQAWRDREGCQEVEAPRIYRQSAHEGGKVSPMHRPHLTPGNIPGTQCFADRATPLPYITVYHYSDRVSQYIIIVTVHHSISV